MLLKFVAQRYPCSSLSPEAATPPILVFGQRNLIYLEASTSKAQDQLPASTSPHSLKKCYRAGYSDLQGILYCVPLCCISPVSGQIVILFSSLVNNNVESSLNFFLQSQIICVCSTPWCVKLKQNTSHTPWYPWHFLQKHWQPLYMVSLRNWCMVHWSSSLALPLCGLLYFIHTQQTHWRHCRIPTIACTFS